MKVKTKNLANTNINYSIGTLPGNAGSSGGETANYGTSVVHPSGWTEAEVELTYQGPGGVTVYLRADNDGHSERAGFDLVEIEDIGEDGGGGDPGDPPVEPCPWQPCAEFTFRPPFIEPYVGQPPTGGFDVSLWYRLTATIT